MRELKRSERGALVYEYKNDKSDKLGALAIVAIVALVALAVLAGLPGDPMHGASKYQGATECAGLIECAQEWGEDGGEYQEEEGDDVTVYDYRGRA